MGNLINAFHLDLAATLECGQAFRWKRGADGWFEGVVGREIWRLRQQGNVLVTEMEGPAPSGPKSKAVATERDPPNGGACIRHYLALDVSLHDITATFPADDIHLRAAVRKHWGLRVLRQEPWECLASFIASSTKQIVQIRQIVAELSRRFGEPITGAHHAFPAVSAIARASHQELWDCKLGFRAKNLLAAARLIDSGQVDWAKITVGAVSRPRLLGPVAAGRPLLLRCDYETALAELLELPGVGEKIANCVLLFSCGFDQAFPIDVWIERALRRLYFGGSGLHPRPACSAHGGVALEKRSHEKVTVRQLRDFAHSHFGPHAGWAQQYLFFNERMAGLAK